MIRVKEMAEVLKHGSTMALYMKDTSRMIKQMDVDDLFMLMAIYTMESGKMIRPMAMEYTATQMVPDMKDNGLRTSKMEKAKRHGQTVAATREHIKTERSMGLVNSNGLMDRLTLVISPRTIFTVMVFTLGQMEDITMANGKTIRWMEKVSLPGQMAVNTMENMSTIKNKDMESSFGLTVADTKAAGRTVNSMGKVFIIQAKEKPKQESGLKAGVSTGSWNNDKQK